MRPWNKKRQETYGLGLATIILLVLPKKDKEKNSHLIPGRLFKTAIQVCDPGCGGREVYSPEKLAAQISDYEIGETHEIRNYFG